MNSRQKAILIGLFIFVIALVPRVLPRHFLTVDEIILWVGQSERFLSALQEGRLGDTVQSYHPGVTTTWLGAAGILISRAVQPTVTTQTNLFAYLDIMRLPIAVVNALCIAASYGFLRRLLNEPVALLACILWATEPFIVAHSAIVHADALSMSFMTLSLLSGWYAFRLESLSYNSAHPVRWWALVFSAVVGGFAVLTKLTTLFIAPMIALHSRFSMWRSLRQRPPLPVIAVGVWGIVVVITCLVFFPAIWTNMSGVLTMLNFGKTLALSPHESGNFFMGQPVQDPGIFFYPLAIALRLAPYTLIGLIVALFVTVRPQRKVIFSLLFTIIAFLAIMTAQPKKFDRYVLQIFPMLDIIAAYGLVRLFEKLRQRLTLSIRPALVWATVIVALLLNLAAYHPYYLAYYNPLLGGGPTAVRTILVGWGEGLDQVASYVQTQQPDCTYNLITDLPGGEDLLRFYFPCEQVNVEATYVVTYVSQVQRQQGKEMLDALQEVEPLFTVHLQGIDYATVYDSVDIPASLRRDLLTQSPE